MVSTDIENCTTSDTEKCATPVAKKSAVLRVTTERSCGRAIAVKAQHLIAVDLKQMQQSLLQSFSRA